MSDHTAEHTITFLSFSGAVKREVARLRSKLKPAAEAGILSRNEFYFNISASGRILDGEVNIMYTLKHLSYIDTGKVEGNNIDTIVDEYLRRAGFDKLNKPLQISATDEIPF